MPKASYNFHLIYLVFFGNIKTPTSIEDKLIFKQNGSCGLISYSTFFILNQAKTIV